MNKNPLHELAKISRDHLRGIQYSNDNDYSLAQSFAKDLDSIIGTDLSEIVKPARAVRGLQYAPIVFGVNVPSKIAAIHNTAKAAFGYVHWTEFYEEDSWSKSFLPAFANGEGIGPDGRLLNSEIILGLFLLGPHTTYPEHAHPAEEFYLVLTGSPEFKVGIDADFELKKTGEVVLHHSEISHSIRSSDEPFYVIYGWRGDIDARSWYRRNMADTCETKKHPTIEKS